MVDAEQLQRENDFLRAVAGNSDKACVYCGLGSADQGKCASGFPGCARGDDQMLCREAGVAMERDELRGLLLRWIGCMEQAGVHGTNRNNPIIELLQDSRAALGDSNAVKL